MNTNLNNIPLEIYLDYITEHTGQEWIIEILLTALTTFSYRHVMPMFGHGVEYTIPYNLTAKGNGRSLAHNAFGISVFYGDNSDRQHAQGNGFGFNYGSIYAMGYGTGYNHI